MIERCINLDWLEIYCLEPSANPRDINYYETAGYEVKPRMYGTPQYREMFTVYEDGEPFLEIRRNPYSLKSEGGVFLPNACHIRLVNKACYEYDPISHLRAFLVAHDYEYKAISRIDIALDFNEFDNTETPERFCRKYMAGKYSKVNQGKVSAHGKDTWNERIFNSLKWGSDTSPITTKLYNKSLELREVEDKPYIRQRWEEAKLDLSRDVWRVEFSFSAQFQTLKSKRSGEYLRKNLSDYDTRNKLLVQFFIMYAKYMDFRKKEYTIARRGENKGRKVLKRKYDCKRKQLFVYAESIAYLPTRNQTRTKALGRTDRILANRLYKMVNDETLSRCHQKAAFELISYFRMHGYAKEVNLRLTAETPTHSTRTIDESLRRWRERKDRKLLKRLLTQCGLSVLQEAEERAIRAERYAQAVNLPFAPIYEGEISPF